MNLWHICNLFSKNSLKNEFWKQWCNGIHLLYICQDLEVPDEGRNEGRFGSCWLMKEGRFGRLANLRDLLSLFYIESFALRQVYCCVVNIWNTLNFYEKVKMFLKLWLKCSIPVQISNPNQARYNLKMSSPSWVCFNLSLSLSLKIKEQYHYKW